MPPGELTTFFCFPIIVNIYFLKHLIDSVQQMDSLMDCKFVPAFHSVAHIQILATGWTSVWSTWNGYADYWCKHSTLTQPSHTPLFCISDVNLMKLTLMLEQASARNTGFWSRQKRLHTAGGKRKWRYCESIKRRQLMSSPCKAWGHVLHTCQIRWCPATFHFQCY